mmetsp:Transcript_76841/g.213482  ORF Transcript_76841/g.213482 Transcript_76841/m.213482 type:complete len:177 (+) Transcript_76841:154-684(+)
MSGARCVAAARANSARALALDDGEPDARLFLERMLLPPGATFSRALASLTFFLMMYGFVYTAWFVAVQGDVCGSIVAAADIAEAEVAHLRAELDALSRAPRSARDAVPVVSGGAEAPVVQERRLSDGRIYANAMDAADEAEDSGELNDGRAEVDAEEAATKVEDHDGGREEDDGSL